MTQRVVISVCYGGFSLSDAAYEKLAEWGIPVRRYVEQQRGEDGLWLPEPANDGEVIFDRELTPEGENQFNDSYYKFKGKSRFTQRYWDTWSDGARTHPLIVRVVEEMGEAANGPCARLRIVEVPDNVEWEISEYDGLEHIAEQHRVWS